MKYQISNFQKEKKMSFLLPQDCHNEFTWLQKILKYFFWKNKHLPGKNSHWFAKKEQSELSQKNKLKYQRVLNHIFEVSVVAHPLSNNYNCDFILVF